MNVSTRSWQNFVACSFDSCDPANARCNDCLAPTASETMWVSLALKKLMFFAIACTTSAEPRAEGTPHEIARVALRRVTDSDG